MFGRTFVIAGIVLAAAPVVAGDISIMYGSDGTTATVTDLGNGVRSYSDSHGTTGTIMDLGTGTQTYQFISPKGPLSGTVLTILGTTATTTVTPGAPPAGMTPTPVLPFTPKGPLMSQPSAPMNSGTGGSGFRFGR